MKLELTKAIIAAKPYAVSSRVKRPSRPVLQKALVTDSHVIATDAKILIRIQHDEPIQEPFMYNYKEAENEPNAHTYPDISRLVPNPGNAKRTITINIADWLGAHKNFAGKDIIMLQNNQLHAYQKDISHLLGAPTGIENIAYSNTYMTQALKTFKNLKITSAILHYYGIHRPIMLTAGPVEILIMPVTISS